MIVVSFCWGATSIGFYGLAYVIKYLKGDLFFKAYSSSVGEVIGKLSTIFLIRCMSLKRILLLGYCISSIGVLLLIICAE